MSVPLEQRRVLDSVFEGLFLKALKAEVNPQLKTRLKGIGMDLDAKLKPLYPHSVWLESLTLSAEELFPQKTQVEALRELGARAVLGYFDTFIGMALKQMLRAIGVRRSLGRMSQNFSATNNYTQTRIKELGDNHVELWMNELTLTQHNMAGIVQTGLGVAGGKNVRVSIVSSDADGVTLDVLWE